MRPEFLVIYSGCFLSKNRIDYIIFSVLAAGVIIVFSLLWKKRKAGRDTETYDTWKDVSSHIPDDHIL